MAKFEAARNTAIKKYAPTVKSVRVPRRVINNDEELKSWLAESEKSIRAELDNGPVSVS